MEKLDAKEYDLVAGAFFALGRAGGNTVDSPYRAAWLELRKIVDEQHPNRKRRISEVG